MSEIRSKRNINLNIQNIVVATYIKGRPVRLGHISVELKRDMLVKSYLLNVGGCDYLSITTCLIQKLFAEFNPFDPGHFSMFVNAGSKVTSNQRWSLAIRPNLHEQVTFPSKVTATC